MVKTSAFILSSRMFGGSCRAGIPMFFAFRSVLQPDRLKIRTMDVKAQSMHEQLRVELGKFGKFQSKGMFEILSQIRKGGSYQVT